MHNEENSEKHVREMWHHTFTMEVRREGERVVVNACTHLFHSEPGSRHATAPYLRDNDFDDQTQTHDNYQTSSKCDSEKNSFLKE